MAIDGFEWDAPDTKENAAAFGFAGAGADDQGQQAFPKVRVVTVSECASHAVADAAMGGVAGKGAGEQSLARKLYRRLDEDWLLIADRNFFNWAAGAPPPVPARSCCGGSRPISPCRSCRSCRTGRTPRCW